MKILIGQPIHEKQIEQIKNHIEANNMIDLVLYPEGYLSNEKSVEEACKLAKDYKVAIVSSYRKDNKDRAIIISGEGNKILERPKTIPDENIELYDPLTVTYNNNTIGYILCMEILKAKRDLKRVEEKIDFVVHPIGVGMFSEEQFGQWVEEAKAIAKKYKTFVIGTSHADGSYRSCGVSIPISYCIDNNGDPIFISKSDTRTRIVDLSSKKVEIIE
ncbi:hypothetical protein [Clostridium folliculivorans]|uniref:CN hydrolase domain-containing protein n=1 Tax=Clostridium folliculivorans TaxID=2886038 RepID=A0A9W6DAB7_9CLOT|nr:hypothetical protein [Clostridium folliculivorans]GKU25049.1 hypothetical protein CFOLD11_18750 [Clostridium folliculivorans]GKU31147.1 hypothetical protein CFB3_32540 [Clostridium folliculivorans]